MPLQKEKMDCFVAARLAMTVQQSPSLRANGSRECAPDDGLREAIQPSPSLRAQRSNPSRRAKKEWIASALRASQCRCNNLRHCEPTSRTNAPDGLSEAIHAS